ncbi:MAG: type IV toxin-antitoxin system AbiEi family antitoxin domain-containing protein [Eggerthellaceae bacterium]|jgi:predicted transcriptional regulator of viral defense system|nr:type IV toxin-antitoxin system AbiEi family antitoxin domain-containing protein [Eggerthellaceae bacterium]
MNEVITYLEKLRELAIDQQGLITTAQAAAEGVPRQELAKMVARGRLARAVHGVYRVPQVPITQYSPFMLAVLWTGVPEACLSHESALFLRELCDVNPRKIHVTVNKGRRFKRAEGEGYQLHFENLSLNQKTWFMQMPIVDIPTAIEQCIKAGLPSYLIEQALNKAGKTSELSGSARARLEQSLEERNVGSCKR